MDTEDTSKNSDSQGPDIRLQPGFSLQNCGPNDSLRPSSPAITASKIRRPRRDEPFTTVHAPNRIACLVDRKRDDWGNILGEEYYPVISDLQNQVGPNIRTIAFHPCVTSSGEAFIYPQKLDPPNTWANSWNASLAQVFSLEQGIWRTVRSDKAAQCYQFEMVNLQIETNPEYPAFQDDLEHALTRTIITSLDHPVVQRILAEQYSVGDLGDIY